MKPIDIACGKCAQQSQELCLWDSVTGILTREQFHPQRIEDAAAITENSNPVSVAAFDCSK